MFLDLRFLAIFSLVCAKCSSQQTESSSTTYTTTVSSTVTLSTTQLVPTTAGIPAKTLGGQPYIWAPGGRHYPKVNQSLVIETDPGYVISVEVAKCDIDGDGGDYLQINPGKTVNNTEARAFTFQLNSPRKYLFHTTQVTAFFRVNDASKDHNGKTGIEITFTRLGEITTTTPEPTTTTIEHPTTAKGEEASIEVDVFGHSDNDYRNQELLNCFRNALLNMSKAFCDANHIIPKDNNITLDNIMVEHLMKCPYSWPDSEKCVQVKFKIPIFLSENSSVTGYELNTQHLTAMWDSYAEGYLPHCDLSIYKEPNIESSVKWWIITSISVTLIFLFLLCIVRKACVKWSQMKRKRRSSDTVTIMSRGSIETGSLEPHYMQKTPPLFEPMYPMYKPGEETFTEPIITAELRNNKQVDETYSEPIITPENFNPQNNRFTLIQDDNDPENEDAYA